MRLGYLRVARLVVLRTFMRTFRKDLFARSISVLPPSGK
jgi:hypothetical protein